MSAIREHQVSTLAHRLGLRLQQRDAATAEGLYQLVEPLTLQPVYPGGGGSGARLDELQDWLQFPWE
jgi:hypothetical protein